MTEDLRKTQSRRRNSTTCDTEGCNRGTSQRRDKYTTYAKYCTRCQNYKGKYGMTGPDADAMLSDQQDSCAACGSQIEFFLGGYVGVHNAVVDHCHSTGKVRGILCGRCNVMLGKAKDDPHVLERCANYLRATSERND